MSVDCPRSLVRHQPPLVLGGSCGSSDSARVPETTSSGSKPSADGVSHRKHAAVEDQTTLDVLNAILPPREWTSHGHAEQHAGAKAAGAFSSGVGSDESGNGTDTSTTFLQYVSSRPATRLDVIELQETLDTQLLERQARESGICPVREELHSQCFDEVLRQVTLECPERGLLMLRIRDEIRMTIAAYQTLYATSIGFGTRKTVDAERGSAALQAKVTSLEEEVRRLGLEALEQRNKNAAVEQRLVMANDTYAKRCLEEKQLLHHQKRSLETFLEEQG